MLYVLLCVTSLLLVCVQLSFPIATFVVGFSLIVFYFPYRPHDRLSCDVVPVYVAT